MPRTSEMSRPQVVVLGAGFGGLTFCQAFSCPHADVTVVDRQNHHLFQPLLYQVATAGLSAPEIAQPIRSILRNKPNVTVLLGNITGIDLERREVQLEGSVLRYDYLVLALGGVTSYFGHPARIIQDELRGFEGRKARPAFKYWDKGMMATIGRSAAVAQIGWLEFSGWLAWAS